MQGEKDLNKDSRNRERRIVFNSQTEYSRESEAKVSPLKQSQESSKLNNLREHRQSDLSYSQDSLEEEDL